MILLIDNYDSFSYNLYQLIGGIQPDIKAIRNNELSIEEIKKLNPSHIILSPGPGRPENAGIIEQVVSQLGENIPILGVCLGHQAICEAFGAKIIYAPQMMHGKSSIIQLKNKTCLFKGLPQEISVARYHSLIADPNSMPACLKITATTKNKEIMAVEHEKYPVFGVQFHPESIMTSDGEIMLQNFINIGKEKTHD